MAGTYKKIKELDQKRKDMSENDLEVEDLFDKYSKVKQSFLDQ